MKIRMQMGAEERWCGRRGQRFGCGQRCKNNPEFLQRKGAAGQPDSQPHGETQGRTESFREETLPPGHQSSLIPGLYVPELALHL